MMSKFTEYEKLMLNMQMQQTIFAGLTMLNTMNATNINERQQYQQAYKEGIESLEVVEKALAK